MCMQCHPRCHNKFGNSTQLAHTSFSTRSSFAGG